MLSFDLQLTVNQIPETANVVLDIGNSNESAVLVIDGSNDAEKEIRALRDSFGHPLSSGCFGWQLLQALDSAVLLPDGERIVNDIQLTNDVERLPVPELEPWMLS